MVVLASIAVSPWHGAAASAASAPAGGVWVNPPSNNFQVGVDGVMILEARAYSHVSGQPVHHVNFTATWRGAGWQTVTTQYQPWHEDRYAYKWNMKAAGVPALTPVTISFDVYLIENQADRSMRNQSPHGKRTVQWGFACVHDPITGGCNG